MKSGAIGTLVASWTYYRGEDNSTILWCENGVLKIGTDADRQVILELRDGTSENIEAGAISTNEKQLPSFVIEEFIDCIVNNKKPTISGEEGLKSLKVILAAFESQATGKVIAVES
jgi:predicted dehydrogenase